MNLKFTVAQNKDYRYNKKELVIGIDEDRKPYFGVGTDDYTELVIVEDESIDQIIAILQTVKAILKTEAQ